MVGKLQLALQMGEQLEGAREGWGTTGTVGDWFAEEESAVSGVRDELRYNADIVLLCASLTKARQRATSICRLSPRSTVHHEIPLGLGIGTRLLRVRKAFLRRDRRLQRREERRWQAERAVLFLDRASTQGDAEAMRVFAAHNVTVLFPRTSLSCSSQ
jgi:hypothetical protein